jgi:hypothetical protein
MKRKWKRKNFALAETKMEKRMINRTMKENGSEEVEEWRSTTVD